jgi:hypothetical protein
MAVSRELVIDYGGYSVSPDGRLRLERDRERGSLSFAFIISATSESAFGTAVRAAEAAFQTPYQDLTVTQGSEELLSAEQSSRTALDPFPSIEKRDEVGSSGRSRRYHVRIDFGLPADTGAEPVSGLRDSAVNVAWDEARIRTVTISGTFTGVGGTSARGRYDAAIDSFAASELTAVGVSSSARELEEEPESQHDTNNNTLTFTRIYRELVFGQAGSSLNDSAIVKQRLTISRRREEPGRTPPGEALATLDLHYEAFIDAEVTTGLRAKYDAIRSWLLTQAENVLGGGQMALLSEEPTFEFDTNRISARLVVVGPPGGEQIFEHRITVEDDDQVGKEILPTWSGRSTDAHVWQGPRIVVRTITEVQSRLGIWDEQACRGFSAGEVEKAAGRSPWNASGGRWVMIGERAPATQLRKGIDDHHLDFTEMAYMAKMRYVTTPTVTSGGGGGGPTITEPP